MTRQFLFTSSKGIDHYQVTDDAGAVRFESEQNTDAITDRNKAMRNHNDGYTPSRELRRVATIPDIIALKWFNEEGWWVYNPDHADRLARKLNDPDFAYLRTADGHIGYSNGVMR